MTQYRVWQFALLLPAFGALVGCSDSSSPSSSANWVGRTFLLDTPALSSQHWTKPKGAAGDVGSFVPQLLIGVAAGTGSDLTITMTTAQDSVQDMCNPTTDMTASGADYPDVQLTTTAFAMRIVVTNPDYPCTVAGTAHDMTLKNVLPGRADTSGSELDAVVDFAELYPLAHALPVDQRTPDAVCKLFADNGVAPCETCAFNGQPYCETLQGVQMVASAFPTPIAKLSVSDIPVPCP